MIRLRLKLNERVNLIKKMMVHGTLLLSLLFLYHEKKLRKTVK
jgi:hypothetical protein